MFLWSTIPQRFYLILSPGLLIEFIDVSWFLHSFGKRTTPRSTLLPGPHSPNFSFICSLSLYRRFRLHPELGCLFTLIHQVGVTTKRKRVTRKKEYHDCSSSYVLFFLFDYLPFTFIRHSVLKG